ncbi:MAG: hypothetical protein D4R65_06905 [Verrucomicrobiaceae bacterium]|nr:MAG: hypothetical protein D4R65_06905 [Verrucomicrobiaceae bacterium]
MRTTIDLPEDLFEETKIAAVKRRTSIKGLIIEGLRGVLKTEPVSPASSDALKRLKMGYHLGGRPMNREEAHER